MASISLKLHSRKRGQVNKEERKKRRKVFTYSEGVKENYINLKRLLFKIYKIEIYLQVQEH